MNLSEHSRVAPAIISDKLLYFSEKLHNYKVRILGGHKNVEKDKTVY